MVSTYEEMSPKEQKLIDLVLRVIEIEVVLRDRGKSEECIKR